MTELEMFDKIIALKDEDSELEACEDVFTNIVDEADIVTLDRDEMLKQYQNLIIDLKALHSEMVSRYLNMIIEARAT